MKTFASAAPAGRPQHGTHSNKGRMASTEVLAATVMIEPPPPRVVPRRGLGRDLVGMVRDVHRFRYLLYQLTLRDVRIRYKQAALGFFWAVFMPVLIIVAGVVVRLLMARISGDVLAPRDVAALAVKALPWAFFVGTIQFATTALVGNVNLITKVAFPRAVLPLSSLLAQVFDTAVGLLALALMLPFLGVRPSLAWLWIPVLATLLLLLTAGSALLLSCANLFFRDVKYIVQVLLTFGIFFTPVFFEPAMLGRTGARLVLLNPLAALLEGFRLTVVLGHNLWQPLLQTSAHGTQQLAWSPWWLAYSALWAVGGLLGSALLFHRAETIFAEHA